MKGGYDDHHGNLLHTCRDRADRDRDQLILAFPPTDP